MQICYQPKGTSINQIVAVRDFWHLDSLYVDGNVPYYNTFYSTYVSIFGPCLHSNLSEGPFDTWCVNYFPPDRINGIRERAMTARPEGYEVLMEWLEEAENHNGFYILGL